MSSIRLKHIVIGLIVAFILFLFYRIGDEDYSFANPGANTQGFIPTQLSNSSFVDEQSNSTSSTWSHNIANPNRHEILQSKVKGYRESTYWGEETSIDEKVRQMNNDEFDNYIEEVEENDADVYWGATYKE